MLQPAAPEELPKPFAEIVCTPEFGGSHRFCDHLEMEALLLRLHDITSR